MLFGQGGLDAERGDGAAREHDDRTGTRGGHARRAPARSRFPAPSRIIAPL